VVSVELVCEGLVRAYGDRFTLGPMDATFSRGVTCLVGPNGAGKSTFFRLAAGLEVPTAGSVVVAGREGSGTLGYLPQDPSFPPQATGEQFLDYVAWLQRVPRSSRSGAVSSALEAVGLSGRRAQRIRTLSGGMVRRLGIAQALVHDPAMLLLDEPTAGLDPLQRVGLREAITAVAENRVVIVSTHLVEDVRGLADRVVVLDDGDVVFDGDVATLEGSARSDAVGDTALERAITGLIRSPE
jgi:ABC-2 type transport system ATP-binding protein